MKKLLFVPALMLSLASCVDLSNSGSGSDSNGYEYDSIAADTIDAETMIDAKSGNWQYREEIDEMTDKTSYYAKTVSTNSVDFGFPYEGGSTLSLTVRDSPQYGEDVFISVSKGQFNSHYNGTTIKMRFDDADPFTVNCSEPSDLSSDILFLNGYSKIVGLLKKSSTMKISVEFFQEGTRTFTFDVKDFKWDH
ncbi:MAG: hypothetical protein HDS53_00910 [Barnesiella sp.]|nr:hypothetical protein [Barnesiella sp.]